MHRHRDDILVVQVEELLIVLLQILHNTDSSCSEYNATVGCISQVSTSIETAEAMSPFQGKVAIWSLSHGTSDNHVIWCAMLDLATPDIDASALIALFKLHLGKLFIFFAETVIFFGSSGFSIFVKAVIAIVVSKSL